MYSVDNVFAKPAREEAFSTAIKRMASSIRNHWRQDVSFPNDSWLFDAYLYILADPRKRLWENSVFSQRFYIGLCTEVPCR